MQEMMRRQQLYEEENRRYQQDKQHLNKAMQNIYDKQKQDQIMKDLDEVRRWMLMASDRDSGSWSGSGWRWTRTGRGWRARR